MNIITVALNTQNLLLNSALIAALPAVLAVALEYGATKRVSTVGLVVAVALYAFLQAGLLYQAGGKVWVQGDELHVQSGFYKAAWPKAALSVATEAQALSGNGTRSNGVAMIGFRAGWFRYGGDKVFLLTTGEQMACIQHNGQVVLCLDAGLPEQLGLVGG